MKVKAWEMAYFVNNNILSILTTLVTPPCLCQGTKTSNKNSTEVATIKPEKGSTQNSYVVELKHCQCQKIYVKKVLK